MSKFVIVPDNKFEVIYIAFDNSNDENLNEKFEIYKSLLNKNIDSIQETLTKL